MKKLLFLIFTLPFILIACNETLIPEAVFHTDTIEPEVGHEVIFFNDSRDANRFEWDFGDGYTSNEVNPVHIFNATGPYEVSLRAISEDGNEDISYLTLNVMVPTLLEIQVLEFYEEYIVPDASILLYPTLTDWDNQTNALMEGITDQYGIAVFAGLEPYIHYVDVWEQNHDNYALAAEDVGFIRTPEVIPHQINRFIAWVDYVEHGKGTGRTERELVIRKLQRKTDEKRQPEASTSTENWQELYERRANR